MREVGLAPMRVYKKQTIFLFFNIVLLFLFFFFSAFLLMKKNNTGTKMTTEAGANISCQISTKKRHSIFHKKKLKISNITKTPILMKKSASIKNKGDIPSTNITTEKVNSFSQKIPVEIDKNTTQKNSAKVKHTSDILGNSILDVETYISFYKNNIKNKNVNSTKKIIRNFDNCISGIPNSVLSYIIIDDPKITEILKDNNNPFKEIVEDNKQSSTSDNNMRADNSSPSEENTTNSDTHSSTNNDNLSQNTSDDTTYGDYTLSPDDNSNSQNNDGPVDSPVQSGSNNNQLESYSNGFLIFNNGEKFIAKNIQFGKNFLILNSAKIPVTYTEYDGLFLLNNEISIFDINKDYFSDYIIINKESGDISTYLNFFNDFLLDKVIHLEKKISISTLYSLDNNGTDLCALSKDTNELLFFSLYPSENFLFKTALLKKYDGILSDDFDGDGFDDLLLSSIKKGNYLYLKNIKGKEISPFLSHIPFTKPPVMHKLTTSKDNSIEFVTFKTKNSVEIFSVINSFFTSICTLKSPSMDIFVLISDFNNDGIPDLAIGHF